jgi:hypothetical protein
VSTGRRPEEPAREDTLTEIDEDLRRRRMSGYLLPSSERQLDAAFAALAPDDEKGGFHALLELADRSSSVDIEVPVQSNLPAGGLAKRALRKAMWWYLDYVAQQLSRFTFATTRLVHVLDDRVSRLEAVGAAADAVSRLAPPFEHEPWLDLLAAATAAAPGPVLHADCADGSVLVALVARGVVAYGVGTRDDLLDGAAAGGLDVRLEHPLRHIGSLADGALGGAVLSDFVDLLTPPAQAHLVGVVKDKLRPGGVLVVLGTSPEAWIRDVPVEVADLSSGRPLHAETWHHLLVAAGFHDAEVHLDQRPDGPASFAVVSVRAS